MIEIENIVFTKLATALRTAYSGITVYGEYVEVPAKFPCVTIVEADNAVYEPTRDLSGVEHHAEVMYEINIYTNKSDSKKSDAMKIAQTIDSLMGEMLFTRKYRGQIPNIDRTIYRVTLRYKGVVREGINVNGTTVYTMHTTL